ncbi:MAG: exo-alpha-sialidase [Planctomycetota bacterium]
MILLLASLCAFRADPAVVLSEFIYEKAPFPSCHATTIADTRDGLVAAWFGGTAEGKPDVGIWVSRRHGDAWTAPVEVATGVQTDGKRLPCWNPVLFQPKDGPLMLFYKVGPSPSTWWGMRKDSADGGKTWGEPVRLPDGLVGPVKNKPVQRPDGAIVSGSSLEGLKGGPSWQAHIERSTDGGKNWTKVAIPVAKDGPASIQPSILALGGNRLLALGRTRSGAIFTTASADNGLSWSAITLSQLPNPNSGTDAVTLRDGTHLLVYNHTRLGRSPLNLAASKDGEQWSGALVLESEPGEYSYPAIIQSADGLVHITYTWKRQKVRHVVIDPAKLVARPILQGQWPKGS